MYNFETESISNMIQDPPVIMDDTIYTVHKYDKKASIKKLGEFLNANKFNTRINCIFHNSAFDEFDDRGIDLSTVYLKIVDFAISNKSL